MKKKDYLSKNDHDEWQKFIDDKSQLPDKDKLSDQKLTKKKFIFDLHGFTLDEANKKVKEIIISCSSNNIKEILFITGKGLHSKNNDVFKSSELGKLKYSVPDFINSHSEISKLISSITSPSDKEGGEGAILVKLKKF